MVAQVDYRYLRSSPGKAVVRLIASALFEGRPLTARARWLNPLVFRLAQFATEHRPLKLMDRPIFIVGTGRSGTTILGTILSLHRSVAFLNEPKALWHIAYRGEDINGNYSSEPARYRLSVRDASDDIRDKLCRMYGTYLRVTRCSRILDKYPELVFRIPFVIEMFPDARIVLVIRNGVDTCRSVANWSRQYGRFRKEGYVDWWGVANRKWQCILNQLVMGDKRLCGRYRELAEIKDQSDMAAVEWTLAMREGLALLSAYPSQVTAVRYEHLTQSPVTVLRSVSAFCNLSYDVKVSEYAKAVLRPSESRSGVKMHPAIRDIFFDTMDELGYDRCS